MIEFLEWASFTCSLLCVYAYGTNKVRGALVGLLTAILFVIWGYLADVYAASLINIVFFILHGRNYRIAINERSNF